MKKIIDRSPRTRAMGVWAGMCLFALCVALGVVAQNAARDPWAVTNSSDMPKYKWDPTWPKPLPNKWKLGGITGLAVDKDDNVWVLTRPNDTMAEEPQGGLIPPITDCCKPPPAMIHIDKNGNVIGSFDPPQGHGMDVDSQGFVYVGNTVNGLGNVRKYDPKTGMMVKELPRAPEAQPGGGAAAAADPPAGAGRGGGGRDRMPRPVGGAEAAAIMPRPLRPTVPSIPRRRR